jgi:hypothetical protein
MATYIVHCKQCGREFEPDHRTIVAATWRLGPACRRQPAEEQHCTQCGRVLRAGKRTLFASCLVVAP